MIFNWDNKKNEQLKRERGVSFEQIVFLIENDFVLDILEHPNIKIYKNQRVYIINVDNYAYAVPFEDKGEERFLKTIFPSRKYTQMYLRKEKEET
ncbi:MAG: toxin [bacterium]